MITVWEKCLLGLAGRAAFSKKKRKKSDVPAQLWEDSVGFSALPSRSPQDVSGEGVCLLAGQEQRDVSGLLAVTWLPVKTHNVCQVSQRWPAIVRLQPGVFKITVCLASHIVLRNADGELVRHWCQRCRRQVDDFESAQFYCNWMCLFAVQHFTKLELAKAGSLLKCRVVSAFSCVNIPTTNQQHQMHFPFFGLWGPFAFGQKVRFLPSFSAENSDGTIPGRQMEADKCSGSFIYLSCIYSVIANGQRAAREHVVESLRCNIRSALAQIWLYMVWQWTGCYIHVRYLNIVVL